MIHPAHRAKFRQSMLWFLLLLGSLGLVKVFPAPDAARGVAGYVPLHTAMEVVAIAMVGMVFGISWVTQKYRANGRALVLGLGLLGVGLLDLSHSLSYAGMPDYVTPSGPEKAINFWLAARSFAAVALLCAAFWPRRWSLAAGPPSRYAGLLGVLLLVGAVHYVLLAQPQWVPRTFLPGSGLTPFKVNFEYTLIALYVVAGAGFLLRLRDARESGVERLALASFTMAMSEYFFTLYANVNDVYNIAGHLYKVLAYGFLYRGLFVETVQRPYQDLQASEAGQRATLSTLPDLLFEVDRQGVYLAVHVQDASQLVAPPS
ncbi:MAG TPA: MASE3 domain-containing protein, partial [Giesbergeria sp.]|nr:MASE3 domain-containing protein [Giesbergeria sp.]